MSIIWITWEDHRRSRELSNSLGADYLFIKSSSNRFVKYIVSSVLTVLNIIKCKPSVVICQNPSIILSGLVVFLRNILSYRVVIDRHSNFKIEELSSKRIKWRIFHCISNYSLKNADLTIVTNDSAREYISDIAGRVFVLPDLVPEIECNVNNLKSRIDFGENTPIVVFVTTFDDDEPILEMINAAKCLSDCKIFFTGNYRKKIKNDQIDRLKLDNVEFTGFIPVLEYESLLCRSDVMVVLTTKDLILNCGAYEAISLVKPVVLSDTKTLREYFGSSGVLYTKTDAASIEESIRYAISNSENLKNQLQKLKDLLNVDWSLKRKELLSILEGFERL